MSKAFGAAVLTMAVALGLTVMAGEKPPVPFQDAMKSNAAATGPMGLRAHVMAKDYDAIAKDAAVVKANYALIEKFWTDRKVEDAIAFSKTGAKAAADLETAAKAKDDAAVTASVAALTPTCGGCHMLHRERMPDMTSEIK